MSWSPVGVKGLLTKQDHNLKASVTHYQSNILSNFCHFHPYEEYSHLRSILALKLLITQLSNAVTHLAVPDVCHFCYYILILRWSSIEKMHGTMESTIFPKRNAECLSDISLWRRPLNQEQCLWLSCTDFTVVEA